jgi:hypothetical protein
MEYKVEYKKWDKNLYSTYNGGYYTHAFVFKSIDLFSIIEIFLYINHLMLRKYFLIKKVSMKIKRF